MSNIIETIENISFVYTDWEGTGVRSRTLVLVLSTLGAAIIPGGMAYAQWGLPVAPPAEVVDDKGVNRLTGGLVVSDPGVSIGMPEDGGLSFTRAWGSWGATVFGGWNHSFNYNVNSLYDNSITVSLGDRSEAFSRNFSANLEQVRLNGSSLAVVNGKTVFTDRDGTVITFSPSLMGGGRFVAESVVKPSGERWTFTYGTWSSSNAGVQAFLKSVQTNFGFQIKFAYSPSSSVINSAMALNDAVEYCDPAAATCSGLVNAWPSVSYARTAIVQNSSYTETVTGPENIKKAFTISTRNAIAGVVPPISITSKTPGPPGTASINYGYTVVQLPYQAVDAVQSVSDIAGTWTYSYDTTSRFKIVRTDPGQFSTVTESDAPSETVDTISQLHVVRDELLRFTNYKYDSRYRLTDVVPPEGTLSNGSPLSGYTHNQYDGRGNVVSVTKVAKAGSGLGNIVYSAGYDATCVSPAKCNKPNWVRDALGNQTDYTYDVNHGGMLSEMEPPPSAGAPRPLTLTTWVQIYGWVKNSSGAMIQSAHPIWRVASKTVCQTVAGGNVAVCDAGAPQTVTSYQYGTSGTRYALLIKGQAVSSGGAVLRTCYDYDIYGRKMSETMPRAGLGVCP